jgi:hypothetical protein
VELWRYMYVLCFVQGANLVTAVLMTIVCSVYTAFVLVSSDSRVYMLCTSACIHKRALTSKIAHNHTGTGLSTSVALFDGATKLAPRSTCL